jgi:hypothetical protein
VEHWKPSLADPFQFSERCQIRCRRRTSRSRICSNNNDEISFGWFVWFLEQVNPTDRRKIDGGSNGVRSPWYCLCLCASIEQGGIQIVFGCWNA